MGRGVLSIFNASLPKYIQHIVSFALVTSLHVNVISRGECVNHGKRGECCTNFYQHNGVCIPCPVGSYGDDCSTTCPPPSYGKDCGFQCKCSPDEVCSPHTGCVKITTASTLSTNTKAENYMKSTLNSIKPENDAAPNTLPTLSTNTKAENSMESTQNSMKPETDATTNTSCMYK